MKRRPKRRSVLDLCLRRLSLASRAPLSLLIHRWEVADARPAEVRGIEIRIERELDELHEVLLGKLSEALDLLAKTDPLQFHRVRTRFAAIYVRRQQRNEYWPDTRTCVVSDQALRERSPATVAITLVHEATHARTGDLVPNHLLAPTLRLEVICVKATLRFSRRLAAAGWGMDEIVRKHEEYIRCGGLPG